MYQEKSGNPGVGMKLVPRKYPTENVVVFMTTAKNVTNEKL
jgi:hypothetical protein